MVEGPQSVPFFVGFKRATIGMTPIFYHESIATTKMISKHKKFLMLIYTCTDRQQNCQTVYGLV